MLVVLKAYKILEYKLTTWNRYSNVFTTLLDQGSVVVLGIINGPSLEDFGIELHTINRAQG